jgi:hypothetical protein
MWINRIGKSCSVHWCLSCDISIFNTTNGFIYFWNLQFLNNVIINKTKVLLPQGLIIFWLSCLGFIAPKTLNYLVFQSFDFEHTWWRLFQKRVVRTNFDIYVFMKSMKTPKGSSDAVNRRRTDNTMTKRKRTKRQPMIKNTTQRAKDSVIRTLQNFGD